MKRFKEGDRVVRIRVTNDRNMVEGATGTVVVSDRYITGVYWDEKPPFGGHTCGGKCEDGYGWNVPTRDLDYLSPTVLDDGDYDTGDVVSMLNLFLTRKLDLIKQEEYICQSVSETQM